MTSADLLPAAVRKRKAVLYVRQSTQAQVQTNIESQRQYELVHEAPRHGLQNVEVIDDDLGRSASGTTRRPGFERLLACSNLEFEIERCLRKRIRSNEMSDLILSRRLAAIFRKYFGSMASVPLLTSRLSVFVETLRSTEWLRSPTAR
jgi:hypothetical protein